ncbi:Mitochondrial aspartate/glutamate carrier protein [Mactra antiquata]
MEKMENETPKKKSILLDTMSGGPKGLGDPNDRSLRTVEADTLIHKLMREKSEELCNHHRIALSECLKDCGNNFIKMISCKKYNRDLKMCQHEWFQDENFKKEMTEKYLDSRAEYRRTGLTKPQREKREKEFLEWQEKRAKNTQSAQS